MPDPTQMIAWTGAPWLEDAAARLLDYLEGADDRSAPVVRFTAPDDLRRAFAEAGAPLPLDGDPRSPAAMRAALEHILAYAVRTQHPRFFNQNFAGADPVAVLADWTLAALNTTAATFEVGPVFTLMEREALARMAALAGWPTHDGIFGPGGSLSNLFALQLARHRRWPDGKRDGYRAPAAVFTSAQAHYSLRKAASLLGMGEAALFVVPCDEAGRMEPAALRAAITEARAQGRTPLLINATAGTTVLGAFDPIEALAAVAAAEGLWLHVDGCHGASTLISPRHRHLMQGVAAADSLAWNPHKMLGITQQCSALLVRHPGLLADCFGARAEYLFQKDKNFGEHDSGDKTFLCGRRADVLKLWLTWTARGDAGLAARIDHAFALAAYAREQVAARPGLVLAAPPSFTHTCFWWVPPALRPFDPATASPEALRRLHRVAPAIKDRMQRAGTTLVGYQPLGALPNFFRLLFINPAVTRADVDAVFDLIEAYGADSERPRGRA